MFYYDVWVRSGKYKGDKPLTYSSDVKIINGSIVQVELQKEIVNGFVSGSTTKPRFNIKNITNIFELPPIPENYLKLMEWLVEFYPSSIGEATRQILPLKFPAKIKKEDGSSEYKLPDPLPTLTNDQSKALKDIHQPDTYLLHGRTGSGKTRVYIELIRETFEENKSCIVLTPEISLTSQLYRNLFSQFGDKVVLLHSKQSPSERIKAWLKILNSDSPLAVIGPRSALFSPLKSLGLIVVDESHENSYKQDQMPHYVATRVASYLSSISRSKLIIGSATPLITDYFLAKEKNKKIIEMNTTAIKTDDLIKNVRIVDLKDKTLFTKSEVLSDELIDSIRESLSKNEQSLLYLNRRGTAKIVICNECGWEALCDHCNLPMTYHGDNHQLICHTCGKRISKIPNTCPECKKESLSFSSIGTKAVVDDVKRIFKGAKIQRFDTDNLKSESIENHLESIRSGKIDIIIGTQLLAKGFDLPKLSTLGVIQADTSLYLPDFSSEERTFQLISQVLGRINRGHVSGKAFIQTFNPEDKIFKYAINHDYESFYEKELHNRKKFKLPPYYHLLKLSVMRKSPESSENAAENLKKSIKESFKGIVIEGPAPSFHEKHGNYYEWILVVKSTSRNSLISVIKSLPSGWHHDIDPLNLL